MPARAPKKLGGKRKGAGRPRAQISLHQVKSLCSLQCSVEDIADHFGVTSVTIHNRRKEDPKFAAAMAQGYADGRVSLRRNLFAQSRTKPASAIFLAKNLLGMREMPNLGTGQDDKPLLPDWAEEGLRAQRPTVIDVTPQQVNGSTSPGQLSDGSTETSEASTRGSAGQLDALLVKHGSTVTS